MKCIINCTNIFFYFKLELHFSWMSMFKYLIYISYGYFQGYSWFKDKILGEEGRRQQAKLREAAIIADRLGCSLSQLALGIIL